MENQEGKGVESGSSPKDVLRMRRKEEEEKVDLKEVDFSRQTESGAILPSFIRPCGSPHLFEPITARPDASSTSIYSEYYTEYTNEVTYISYYNYISHSK